ncbi:hypothetical protein GCM10011380_25350 [Sphingomonas metalli]|uniref:CheW-like domain-containing protein n=1 Tax=Sphingomonas metalli TaxID=1779358 RepID=A0A916T7P0_9SPHN|nr:chemotaxis protein CheW [Sphingomonas metalli]GGB34852.1 hypothetical protein GCM10011380_25350 [Sphingomonas metalli]
MTELFLIVSIAGRWVALPATEVKSAVDISGIVAVPRAPAAVRGLAALRSRVVTVIDTAVSLGGPPTEPVTRAVIAEVQGHHYALLIDALDDVFALERQPLSPGLGMEGQWTACATGIVEREGEPLLVLDLSCLVPSGLAQAA